jgi:PD-(D/E)XK nuclease superfamily
MSIDIISPPKQSVAFDATLLASLTGCARFTDIRFNHRLVSVGGKSNSLEVGTLIHKVLEVYYQHMINGFGRANSIGQAEIAGQLFITGCPYCANEVDVPEGTKLKCGHEPGEYPGMQNTPEESEQHKVGWKFAMKRCAEYFEHYKNDSFIPLAAEKVEKGIIYEDDEIRVGWKAKLDLLIDTNQIGIMSMDHKTFKQRRDKTTLSHQFMGHCVLLNTRNVLVNKIGLQSSLKIDECLSRELVSFSKDRLDEWQNEIVPYYAYKYLQYKDSGYWPPDFTRCDNIYGACPYKRVCEADRGMREEELRLNFIKAPVWDPRNKDDE